MLNEEELNNMCKTEKKVCDFKNDLEFSEQFIPVWDKYYYTEHFNKLLQKLSKRGKLFITKIDRSDNLLFQKETHLDVVILLSNGTSLKIDEKVLRYKDPEKTALSFFNNYPVEVSSNPTLGNAGWAYNDGTLIIYGRSNKTEDGFVGEPLLFKTTEKFKEEICRNSEYKTIPSLSTNGLYRSVCKLVPREVLEKYYP